MISYKDAGVDIDAGNNFVEAIKPYVKKTFNANVLGGIGSFSGAYALNDVPNEPVLLAATDGVGTKLRLAIEAQKFDTIGIDLVAMCVNDLICNFATPMFFLDYYATGKLRTSDAVDTVKGISAGCQLAQCALIGGETAEMPGMYSEEDFDLAGFAVGMASKNEIDRTQYVKEGDVILALPSSGIHSNGYSLVRKLFFDKLGMTLDAPFENSTLKEVLLAPTQIYVPFFKQFKEKIHALAHITGGGIVENLPRVLPEGLKAVITEKDIRILPVFDFMSKYVEKHEMYRTFNMGVGMTVVVHPDDVESIVSSSDAYVIGKICKGDKSVELI